MKPDHWLSTELQRVKRIVTHESCADGIASALILHSALPDAEIVFVQYNDPAHRDLVAEPGLLFCDMTPPPERAAEFVEAGAIVLDHHVQMKGIVEQFGVRGIYADAPGVSGALLAFTEVWEPLVPRGDPRWYDTNIHWMLAKLAGIRDTWQKDAPMIVGLNGVLGFDSSWTAACAQGEALVFWPWEKWRDAEPRVEWGSMLEIGTVLLERKAQSVARAVERAHCFTTANGVRVVCFEGTHLSSDAAEAVGDTADLVIGWNYFVDSGTGQRIVLSCRTRGDAIDVGAFAKSHPGGGGHTRAAGFQLAVGPTTPNPYAAIEAAVARLTPKAKEP